MSDAPGTGTKPLWSDNDIARYAKANIPAWDNKFEAVYFAMKHMKRGYQARIAELTAQLAERGEWEVVPDGTYRGADAQQLTYVVEGTGTMIRTKLQGVILNYLPIRKDWKLMRRVPTKGEGDANS